ncbi:MAG TPA: ABC transporter ATP-binding protein [Planctomycetota bacterium]|nr:ABC transporter ATP-binding protein [Planctomycetota bacterium]
MSELAIRTRDLVKRYDGAGITALAGVSIDVERGHYLCIMGPSGSGKSTLLNLVGALDVPTSGDVVLNGRSLATESNLDVVRAREIGFIFQLHNLIPTLTAVENVEIPMMAIGVPRRARKQRAVELLTEVGLSHRLDSVATRLSGGERQRVSIARALANRPSVILADEPTGDVDSRTGEQIMECIQAARKQCGATLVVVTHNPEISRGAERTLHMKDGLLQ